MQSLRARVGHTSPGDSGCEWSIATPGCCEAASESEGNLRRRGELNEQIPWHQVCCTVATSIWWRVRGLPTLPTVLRRRTREQNNARARGGIASVQTRHAPVRIKSALRGRDSIDWTGRPHLSKKPARESLSRAACGLRLTSSEVLLSCTTADWLRTLCCWCWLFQCTEPAGTCTRARSTYVCESRGYRTDWHASGCCVAVRPANSMRCWSCWRFCSR